MSGDISEKRDGGTKTGGSGLHIVVYVVLAVLVVVAFYLIFNAGNPNSFLRIIVPDPAYDIAVTVGVCVAIAVIALFMGSRRDREESIEGLLRFNMDYIKELKRKGKSDEEISESFLDNLGVKSGLFRIMAKRRTLKFLSRLGYSGEEREEIQ